MKVIKYILISISEILQDRAENEIFGEIVDSYCLQRACQEKKKLKKTKLDIEVLRKKSRKLRKLATRTKNMLMDSISKIAGRMSFKKQKSNAIMDEIKEENAQQQQPLVEETEKQKVETIKITLNIVEYAPKIFERLRNNDGVGVKEITEFDFIPHYFNVYFVFKALWIFFWMRKA